MVYVTQVPEEDEALSTTTSFEEEQQLQRTLDSEYEDLLEDDDDADEEVTFLDKLFALKYLIPFTFRHRSVMLFRTFRTRSTTILTFLGNTTWILTTSLFLVGFPMFYEFQKEQQLVMMENEQKLFPQSQQPSADKQKLF